MLLPWQSVISSQMAADPTFWARRPLTISQSAAVAILTALCEILTLVIAALAIRTSKLLRSFLHASCFRTPFARLSRVSRAPLARLSHAFRTPFADRLPTSLAHDAHHPAC